MKRLFWLGVGLAAGAYLTRRATEAAQNLTAAGSARTWPTACASWVPGWVRSVPRSAPGCRPARRN